jgi:Polyglycine hydrolase-like, structural repeat
MFEAYHGVTGAEHQTNFDRLLREGYRMISLSMYGDPGNPLYTAVWVQRQGPAWVAVHGVDSAGYQTFFNTWTARDYVPIIISATGPADSAVFAAAFEQGISGGWFACHGLTSGPEPNAGTFQHQNALARSHKMILRSFARRVASV